MSAGRRSPVPEGDLYAWDPDSTYVQEPPFFQDLAPQPGADRADHAARACWCCSATRSPPITSRRPARSRRTVPAGQLPASSTAWSRRDFNSYGARRGNHEVMMRGTFGNIRLSNELVPGTRGRLDPSSA